MAWSEIVVMVVILAVMLALAVVVVATGVLLARRIQEGDRWSRRRDR